MAEQQNIIQGLDRIAQWAKIHPEQDIDIFPGTSSVEIEKVLKGFPFKIPTELRHLYEHGHTSIFLGPCPSRFRDIQDSIGSYSYEEFWIADSDEEERIKILNQYPPDGCNLNIAYGGGKQTYFIKCYKTETDYSPIWVRHIGLPYAMYASSLTNLILTWAECYESGAYYSVFDEENDFHHLQEDWSKIQSIFEKYNLAQMDVWKSCYGEW